MIKFENASKSYAGVAAISNLNLEIEQGELVVFLGPSGSGKSSLIDKSIDYLKLERPLDHNIFIIDNLVEFVQLEELYSYPKIILNLNDFFK